MLARSDEVTAQQTGQATAYADGLAAWRVRDVAGVVWRLTGLAEIDPPSALLLRRAQSFVSQPPGPGWEPVNALEGKIAPIWPVHERTRA